MRETPRQAPRVHVEPVNGSSIPLQCRHCEDAPCVAICPTQAMHKLGPEMPVLIDEARCIGCKLCVLVCPFGVVTLREGGKVALKCDLCVGRGEQGLDPACVSACKTQALQFLSTLEIARRKRLEAAKSMQASQACEGK
jgi:carbon-monoxide dehydrogenase iron sulfur subunit